jgi:hypothetical protein
MINDLYPGDYLIDIAKNIIIQKIINLIILTDIFKQLTSISCSRVFNTN